MSTMIVIASNLNMRRAPEIADNIITVLPRNHIVEVLAEAPGARFKEVTTKFNAETLRGFVSARFLRELVSDPKEALIREAMHEWHRFDEGNGLEHHAPFFEFVGEMWQALGLNLDGRNRDVPWSAAFISFIMRNAGYDDFKFSSNHARYIVDAIKQRDAGNNNASFWGFRLHEHRPQLGDLTCQWRIREMSFDRAEEEEFFPSHCDVVVDVREDSIRTLGGNVNQSVRMKTFALDGNKFLKPENKLFAILRNNR